MSSARLEAGPRDRRRVSKPLAAALSLLAVVAAGSGARADGSSSASPVDPFYGSYATSVRVDVPSFHGLEPQISLEYNSQLGNGKVGVGWGLSGFPTIERASPGKGAPRYDGSDIFLLDGQELVPCTSLGGTHCTKIQSYRRITWDAPNNAWYVTEKDGKRLTFSALYQAGAGTFRWALTSATDPRGNTISYGYWCDPANDCYPSSATYGGDAINLYWEARPDPISFSTGSSLGATNYRLKTIDVLAGGARVGAYELSYATSAGTGRSMLASTQRFGTDAAVDGAGNVSGGTAAPAQTYGYETTPYSLGGASVGWPTGGYASIDRGSGDQRDGGVAFGDFNGDGKQDVVWSMWECSGWYGSGCAAHNEIWLGTGNGFVPGPAWPTGGYLSIDRDGTGDQRDGGVRLADFNGDGKTDIAWSLWECSGWYGSGCAAHNEIWLSTGTGFTPGPAWPTGGYLSIDRDGTGDVRDGGVRITDMNGDGKADVVWSMWECSGWYGDGCQAHNEIWLGTGSGWVAGPAWPTGGYLSIDAGTSGDQKDGGVRLVDLNGDGKQDVVWSMWECSGWYGAGCAAHNEIWMNTGSGWAPGPAWPTGGYLSIDADNTGNQKDGGVRFADMNGDGKQDVVWSMWECSDWYGSGCQAHNEIWLNAGTGWVAGPAWPTGGYLSIDASNTGDQRDGGVRIVDMDGDARADVVWSMWECSGWYGSGCQAHDEIWMNRGNGFAAGPGWPTGGYLSIDASNTGDQRDGGVRIVDLDGDGKQDVLWSLWECSGWYGDGCAAHNEIHLGSGGRDVANSVSNGHGGTTTIAYAQSSAWSNTYLPSGMVFPTVQSTTTSDGRGSSSTTSYTYGGGLWSDVERRFLGFRKVTSVVDAAGDYTETYYHQHVGCISKPETTYYRDANGNIYKYSTFGYTENSSPPYTSLMTDRWEYECNQGSSCRRTLLQIGYDQYGNGTTTYEWGDYDVSGDERTTVRASVPNTDAYIVGAPAYENVYAGIGTSGALLKQTLFVYDGNAGYANAPTRGLLTSRQGWNSQTGGYFTRSYGYDAWGNAISETDENGHTSTIAYDANHVHEVRRCNALGQCSSKSWVGAYDILASETDANGNVTSYTHDALMRPVTTTQANGKSETLSYLDWGNAGSQRVRRAISDGSADGLWTDTYEDGAGRVWRVVKKGGQTQDTLYSDVSKRAWKKSSWYVAGETPQYQTMSYDGLGRLRTVTNADGSMGQMVYGNGYVASYDELGHEKVTWSDAFGATSQVREKNGSAYYFTTYQHDLLGNLVKVTDANGNVTQASWDSLGRKLAGCDPDTGCSSYQYDATGALVWRQDAKGQVTTVAYDAVGRPVQRVLADGTTISWTYDEAGHGASIGRLTTVNDASGSEARSYDAAGAITSTTKCISGLCATTSYAFDAAGRPSSIGYPNGEVVTYGYDASGRITSVPGYVNAIAYDGRGQITSITYANGTTASYGYDAARGWLASSSVMGPTGALFAMTYGYDAAARVTSTSSSTNPLSSLSFGYDDLNRLTSVSGGQSQSFAYDAIGNMTSASSVGAYAYGDPSHVHAVTSAGANGYSYDANGNELTGAGRTLSWTAEDRLASVTNAGATVSYAYDHAGERVKRSAPAETRYYFSRLAEQTATGTWTNNVYAGEILVAKNVGGAKRWYHADHLGSTRVITDASGQAIQSYDYAAYGAPAASNGASGNTRTWAGQDVDPDSGLTYMHARFYDAWLGRFVSADTVVPDARSPQAFNRYSYGFDNPIANTDPSGHVPVVAAIAVATSVGVAAGVTSTVFVIAVVGAATTTVGYFTHDATLMSIGGVLLGAASGYQFGAGFLAGAQTTAAGVWGGAVSALTSPISPLSPDLKNAIGWAYAAQGFLYQYEHINESITKYADDHTIEVDRGAVQAKLDELERARPLDYALKDDPSAWSSAQKMYGEAMSRITKGVITPGEAIALNPTGGLVGPGGGALEQFLDPTTGWIPGIRLHSVLHDAYGWLASTSKNADVWTIGGLGVGPGYFYAGYNFFGVAIDNPLGGQIEGIARNGGFSVNALFGRMY